MNESSQPEYIDKKLVLDTLYKFFIYYIETDETPNYNLEKFKNMLEKGNY